MASSSQARRLTETHRLAQARISAVAVQALRSAFLLLDPQDLDATTQEFLRTAVPIVMGQQALSAQLAAQYLAVFRRLELPGAAAMEAVIAAPLPPEQVATALTVTGPVSIKSAMARGVPLDTATKTAQANIARAGIRLVLSGGRNTITATTHADPKAIGWARATSGSPCAFCAKGAAKGIWTERGAHMDAHDGCHCSAEPIYRDNARLPAGSSRWKQLWDDAGLMDGDQEANFSTLLSGG